jgi:outer membrane protein assembly factor BamB
MPTLLHPTRPACSPVRLSSLSIILCVLACGVLPARADDWPQWRGPDGDGTSRETSLPVVWDKTSGIKWQCALPEWGDSTPAIWQNSIFLTTQVDNRKMFVLKIDKTKGQIEWTRQVGDEECPQRPIGGKPGEQRRHQSFASSHNFASPSPVTDGRHVVVHFGDGDLAAYDFDGRQLWKRNLQKDYGDYTIWWGHANSPVLCGDLVISVCMQDSCADLPGRLAPSYVVAHDLATGRERWKTPRMTTAHAEECDSYVTPIFWKNNGRLEMVVLGGRVLDAYEPSSGKRFWELPDLVGSRTITGATIAHGMIYATQGMREPLLAVRPGGDGKRTSEDVVWKCTQATPDSITPVVWQQWLFMVSNEGIAQCLDAKTGRVQWKKRLKGDYRASPVAADGRVYFLNTRGLTTVVAASRDFRRLAENALDDDTLASPAVSSGRLYIRGRKALYCIGK